MATNLKGKKVLITAGPTWVPIDSVRVISNTATGKTGILLADSLARQGAKVTLLLGPVGAYSVNKKVKIIDFKFFDELNYRLKGELKKRKYAAVIHAAAVSDYKLNAASRKKISSHKQCLNLTLKQTPKIINALRKLSPGSFLVGFKFEPDLAGKKLILKARGLFKRARLDLVAANSRYKKHYIAYLVSAKNECGPFLSKEKMVKGLAGLIGEGCA
ncbi:MAG: phosphopantothenoylcysteine decarboxylase [Candidatus Omnitrophota bacterium]|nr:phosphopantothenoylcysteine decarboxylase [Candidatus Omnitrophota bacterium]